MNISRILVLVVVGFSLSCASSVKEKVDPDYFPKMDGCFLLYNMGTQQLEKVIGNERCAQQLPACSTFKVPLAVIAFDSGILKDEKQILKWDGKVESRPEVNRDQNAQTWMRDSVVWFSQRLAVRLGPKKFQSYLDRLEYGNRDLSAGLTSAWLISPAAKGSALKISGYEQIEFLKKLWRDQLPASKRSQALTREITYLETSPQQFRLSGKTGSNFYDKDRKVHLGWFIGHLQKGDQEYLVVTNLSDREPTDQPGFGGARAKAIAKTILADLKLW